MNSIENIIGKIKLEYQQKLEAIKQEFELKKKELQEHFDMVLKERQESLKSDYEKKLELEKKRIFTEVFIEFNKKVEFLKQKILKHIFDQAKTEITKISKEEYYNFIKSLIIKNFFHVGKNEVLFDRTEKLSLKEKQQLIKEVQQEIKQKHYPAMQPVEITILDSPGEYSIPEFGIKIISGKKSTDCSLQSIFETLRAELEIELAKMLFS